MSTHQWEEFGGSMAYPLRRLRRCKTCLLVQQYYTRHDWGRVVGYHWHPNAGRCGTRGLPLVTYRDMPWTPGDGRKPGACCRCNQSLGSTRYKPARECVAQSVKRYDRLCTDCAQVYGYPIG